MLSLLLLSSALSAKIAPIDALTAAEAGDANAYDAGIAEAYQSIESTSKPYNNVVEATVADESVQPGFWARTRDRLRNHASRASAAIRRGVERTRSAIGQGLKRAGSAVKGSTTTVNNIDTLN